MSWFRPAVLAWLILCGPIGCVVYESGDKLDPNLVAQIHRGTTTRAEAESLLGPPMNVEIIAVGQRRLSYWYKQVTDSGVSGPFMAESFQTRHQRLTLWIGPTNRVDDLEFTDYLTVRATEGTAVVVKRAAVPTQPSAQVKWYNGGDEQ